MKKQTRTKITSISFLIVLVYFLGITLSVEFLHKSNEDPAKCHDDCSACNWSRQLQDTSQTISAAQVCEQIQHTFFRFIITPEECSTFQSIVLANPLSRAPPVA